MVEPNKTEKFYDKNYKKLLLIPNILLIIALAIIVYHYSTTGEIINKDVSLKGGVTATVYTDKQIDISELENYLKTKLGDALIRRLSEFGTDKQIGLVIDTSNTNGDLLQKELETKLNLKLDQSNYSSEQFGSSLGQSFYKQMLIALGLSFLFMAIVVFITFRNFIPSTAVVYAAFMDIVIPVAITILFNIKISAAGISALLMLIGYSIDTDILLTTRVLKRKEGSIWERMTSSAKTGLTMTFAAIVALLAGYFITSSLVIKEMFFIIVIGLFADIPSTWLMNAGILKWYVGRKENVTKENI
ncbi:MAG: protein translocase subunit SecF [Candidatus Woesearchaeota archaeon]|nr:protein translocase subunit SecF [Candidatus Woesearchaeota archaeon]